MSFIRKALLGALAAGLLFGLVIPTGSAGASVSSLFDQREATYEITVENLTRNQILTPPVWTTHWPRADFFEPGEAAPYGVKEIAENGNLEPLDYALSLAWGVSQHGIAPDGPIPGGTSRTFTVGAKRWARELTSVMMVVCTNDGFTGTDGIKLPRRTGATSTLDLKAYDAGTEVNTEALVDLVPPCSEGKSGTGVSNPELAEGGVITPHPGITNTGGKDGLLDPEFWGFDQPVARMTITRTA